ASSAMYASVLPIATSTVTDAATPMASSPNAPPAPIATKSSSSYEVAVTARPRTDSVFWLPPAPKTPLRTSTAVCPSAVTSASRPTNACVLSMSTTTATDAPNASPSILTPAEPAAASTFVLLSAAIAVLPVDFRTTLPSGGVRSRGSLPAYARVSVISTSTTAPPAPATEFVPSSLSLPPLTPTLTVSENASSELSASTTMLPPASTVVGSSATFEASIQASVVFTITVTSSPTPMPAPSLLPAIAPTNLIVFVSSTARTETSVPASTSAPAPIDASVSSTNTSMAPEPAPESAPPVAMAAPSVIEVTCRPVAISKIGITISAGVTDASATTETLPAASTSVFAPMRATVVFSTKLTLIATPALVPSSDLVSAAPAAMFWIATSERASKSMLPVVAWTVALSAIDTVV